MSGSGRSNAALLKQLEEKNPLLGLGCSYSPYPVRLWIQDMKNYYVDFYRFASKHVHFIHFKARSRLPNEVVAKVEDDLRDQVLKANEEIDEAIVQAETLMKAHGITLSVTDTPNCSPPFCHTAEIISPLTNRYIQLIEKTDYLLRALDPLFQKEVISMEEYNLRRGLFKRHVKRFYYACRRFDEGLRGRMDASEAATANGSTRIKGNRAADAMSGRTAEATSATGRGLAKSRRPKAIPIAHALDQVSGGQQAGGANAVDVGEMAKHALAANAS
ncbi:MAG: hypothetical protein M3037_13730 [Gemmatimonadota bacterium]|nr:hypothetical protein [Gemmatimonadota bacterium]